MEQYLFPQNKDLLVDLTAKYLVASQSENLDLMIDLENQWQQAIHREMVFVPSLECLKRLLGTHNYFGEFTFPIGHPELPNKLYRVAFTVAVRWWNYLIQTKRKLFAQGVKKITLLIDSEKNNPRFSEPFIHQVKNVLSIDCRDQSFSWLPLFVGDLLNWVKSLSAVQRQIEEVQFCLVESDGVEVVFLPIKTPVGAKFRNPPFFRNFWGEYNLTCAKCGNRGMAFLNITHVHCFRCGYTIEKLKN